MNLIYRPSDYYDRHLILNLYNDVILEGGFTADLDIFSMESRDEWFSFHERDPYRLFVVLLDDQFAGYFYFSPWRAGRRALADVVEVSFYLSPSLRGMGIGKAIMNWLQQEAAMRKFRALIAIVLDTNTVSSELLEKSGFEIAGHIKDIAKLNDRRAGQYVMIKYTDSD